GIACAALREMFTPLRDAELQRLVEELLDPLPAFGGHTRVDVYCSSLRSQARARLHSRSTMVCDTPSTAAVSRMVRPPKNRISTMLPCLGSSSASAVSARSSAIRSMLWPPVTPATSLRVVWT